MQPQTDRQRDKAKDYWRPVLSESWGALGLLRALTTLGWSVLSLRSKDYQGKTYTTFASYNCSRPTASREHYIWPSEGVNVHEVDTLIRSRGYAAPMRDNHTCIGVCEFKLRIPRPYQCRFISNVYSVLSKNVQYATATGILNLDSSRHFRMGFEPMTFLLVQTS